MADATPEMDLLLACASPHPVPLPPLAGIDWDALMEAAQRHRMVMLLARRVLPAGDIPSAARERLAEEARGGSARALGMLAELAALLRALEGAGIAAAAYKGPVLAVQAYGDPSLRWCSDLDLLVSPASVGDAIRCMEGMGYRALKHLSPAREAMFRRTEGDFPLRHEIRGTLVELHCHVSTPRFAARFDTDALLRRRRPVVTGPFQIPALAEVDLLIALAVHGAKHRWARLEWLAAFAALLARGGHDPHPLQAAATGLGAGRAFAIALELASRLPGGPGARATDPSASALADEAWSRMLGTQPRYDARDTADNLGFNLRLCDTAADRARTAWRWATLPTAEDWGWIDLPDAFFPVYRGLRPLRLLWRYGRPGTK